MRSFVGAVLVLATAVTTICVPLFVGHGLANHTSGPIVFGAGFLLIAAALATTTLWWNRRASLTHSHGTMTHAHPHSGPHTH